LDVLECLWFAANADPRPVHLDREEPAFWHRLGRSRAAKRRGQLSKRRLNNSSCPKEVDGGIVHCASRCDTSSPTSGGPAACWVKAPVGVLIIQARSRAQHLQMPYRPLNSGAQKPVVIIGPVLFAAQEQSASLTLFTPEKGTFSVLLPGTPKERVVPSGSEK